MSDREDERRDDDNRAPADDDATRSPSRSPARDEGEEPVERSPKRDRSASPKRDRSISRDRQRSRSRDRERRRSPSRERDGGRNRGVDRPRDRGVDRPRDRDGDRNRDSYRRRDRSSSRDRYRRDRSRSPPRRSYSPPRYRERGGYGGYDMPNRREPPRVGLQMFVAGFNFLSTESDVERRFGKYGRVTEVRIVRDSMGKSRGFGFVAMDSERDVQECIQAMNGRDWEGRRLQVELCRNPK